MRRERNKCEPLLVVCQSCITGDSRFSLIRASAVVKRQSPVTPSAFRRAAHAVTSRVNVSWSAIRRCRHWRLNTLSSLSAIFSQLPGLGVYTNSKRRRTRQASAGAKVADSAAEMCVVRLSRTTVITSALVVLSGSVRFRPKSSFGHYKLRHSSYGSSHILRQRENWGRLLTDPSRNPCSIVTHGPARRLTSMLDESTT